ncbi:uncharacterized protein LOC143715348 [Siphateles boraxobius]|uniref:uncharacterized protein LOC143715348 n=1 Tax=Siphateles boraxobius TaxID=180520 RepID=UPI0040648E7D
MLALGLSRKYFSIRGKMFTLWISIFHQHGSCPYPVTLSSVFQSVAHHIVPGPLTELTGLDVEGLPQQQFGIDCGIFMMMYSWYAVMEAPFDFTIHDMPCLRRWWCTMLVENLEIEGHGRRFAHFTMQGIQMARGSLDPIFRIPRKRKYNEVTMLPEEILHRIFILVVLQDGDPALHTLALTCTHFWRIVREESFLKEAHFCWLDSVVNWNSFSEDLEGPTEFPIWSPVAFNAMKCSKTVKDTGDVDKEENFKGSTLKMILQDTAAWTVFMRLEARSNFL